MNYVDDGQLVDFLLFVLMSWSFNWHRVELADCMSEKVGSVMN